MDVTALRFGGHFSDVHRCLPFPQDLLSILVIPLTAARLLLSRRCCNLFGQAMNAPQLRCTKGYILS